MPKTKKSNFLQYQPEPESLAASLIDFFKRQPEEQLSAADIEIKFDVPAGNVKRFLLDALEQGAINLVGRNYCAGPMLLLLLSDAFTPGTKAPAVSGPAAVAVAPAPKPTKTTKQKTGRIPRDLINLSAITIDEGVELIGRHNPHREKWTPLLIRLTKVGQSFVLPLKFSGAIGVAIAKKHHTAVERYRKARVNDSEVRVWRVL